MEEIVGVIVHEYAHAVRYDPELHAMLTARQFMIDNPTWGHQENHEETISSLEEQIGLRSRAHECEADAFAAKYAGAEGLMKYIRTNGQDRSGKESAHYWITSFTSGGEVTADTNPDDHRSHPLDINRVAALENPEIVDLPPNAEFHPDCTPKVENHEAATELTPKR